MDINKQYTPVDEPVMAINIECLAEITDSIRNMVKGGEAKDILNLAYELALARLHSLVDSRNSASWILEAYKQTLMWTAVLRKEHLPNQYFEAPKELAPIGRYGWRYVIEYLLKKGNLNSISRMSPDADEVSEAFTLLSILANSAEWSDLMHFFPDVYGCVEFDLGQEFGLLTPILDQKAEAVLVERAKYMQKVEFDEWRKYTRSSNNEIEYNIEPALGLALNESYGFTVDQLRQVVEALAKTALSSGLVIILPGPYLINWVAEEGGVAKVIVKKVIDFMLLSSDTLRSVDRDFFNKRDPLRMINYAGVRIDRLKNLKSIYPKQSTVRPDVKNASWHVIINIFMVGEWLDIFLHKCANGQRQDLKAHPVLNRALEEIEQYQRRNVFETVVADIFSEREYKYVKSLKKCINDAGRLVPLPCGEIDVIAYSAVSGVMFVVECKASAPAIDSRGFAQQYKDHFVQKKYHQKFLSKIEWVNNNLDYVSGLGDLASELDGRLPMKVVSVMVTRYPNIVRFYVDDYPVITFAELGGHIDMCVREEQLEV
ncbi:hypothetical protein [Pseudomonas peli]|uniref:hypothetical protein n=1 Tax=Pseudomonas peli TaxID=592361 RepID=UPI0024ACE3B6|nr:hypothetical protein [Pseudomonas peli]